MALLPAPWARAAALVERLGPLELEGRHAPLKGPMISKTVLFREAGWVRGLSVRVAARPGTPAARGASRLTLATFGAYDAYRQSDEPRLFVGPGESAMRLPEGLGVAVEPGVEYRLRAQLHGEAPVEEAYDFEFELDFVPRRAGGVRAARAVFFRLKTDENRVEVPAGRAVWGRLALMPGALSARLEGPDGRELFSRGGAAAAAVPEGGVELPAGSLTAYVECERDGCRAEPRALGLLFLREEAR